VSVDGQEPEPYWAAWLKVLEAWRDLACTVLEVYADPERFVDDADDERDWRRRAGMTVRAAPRQPGQPVPTLPEDPGPHPFIREARGE
jgi:hypothetical protein